MPLLANKAHNLQRVGKNWKFRSEADLEDFVWSNLQEMLNATPLKRQFSISGQFCDILAVNHQNRLLIIELKNDEDRYVVNQITRYYDALLEEKPLVEIVDYSKPTQLIVIAPNFHRDNQIDRKYSQLTIQFVKFEISISTNQSNFILTDIDTQKRRSIKISYHEESRKTDVPEPPRKLLNLLADTPESQREIIFSLRDKILGFHSNMQEFVVSGSLLYGKTKNKTCAELRYDGRRNSIALFLWLPLTTSVGPTAKRIVARMRIWTDWSSVSAVGHVPKGTGRMVSFEEWRSASIQPLKKLLPSNSLGNSTERFFTDREYRESFVDRKKFYTSYPHYKSGVALSINKYIEIIGRENKECLLQELVNLALETWFEKL